jgi:hypothetical protein
MAHHALLKKNLLQAAIDILVLGTAVLVMYQLLAPVRPTAFHPVSMDDLRGVWITTQPRYKDRYLQFADGTITFGWGDAGEGSYAIKHIESEPAGKKTLVHVRYIDRSATPYRLNFYYEWRGSGEIRIKNQKGVFWYRSGSQPTYPPSFK